jgi:hypothetical protein
MSGAQTVSPPLAWYAPTLAAASTLLQLPDNWDQHGAMRVKPAIVQAAMTLLNGIMLDDTPAPSVVPTVRGGIQLEWHTRGIDLEIEFLSPNHVQGLFEDQRESVSWEEDLASNIAPLHDAIARLSRL